MEGVHGWLKKKWHKIITLILAFSIAGTNIQIVEAAEENTAVTEKEEINNPEATDNANSWRYKNGERIPQRLRSSQYTTWPADIEGAEAYGIDVSEHQGKIDWTKAKAAGVDYAIIRCGYGQDLKNQDDAYWKTNADACEKNGIPFGTYLYSYADTVAKAKSEAQHVLRLVEGYDLSYPVYYDLEDNIQSNLSKKEIADIAEAFCDTIEAAGYEAAIYANLDWFTNYLTDSRFDQWDKWVAQWGRTCTYTGSYNMWQCSSEGSVDGINGNVDLNIDLGAKVKTAGFYQDPDTAEWYYCINGEQAEGLNDVIKGTVNGEKAWWHVVDGKVTYDDTVAKNSNGWWVIRDGKVDFSYTGFAENSNGWWYCEDGKVQFGTSSVIKGTVNGEKAWWYVVKGEVTFTETVAKNSNGWWHIQDGKVNFDSNTVAKNSKGWWVIRDGKVDFSYTGFAENSNGWWYCEDGKVQFEASSVLKGTVKGEKAWWHVVKGEVIFDETVAKNKNGWWYIKDGKVDFTFNGIASNKNGSWLCQNGKVNFGYSGTYTKSGITYKIERGKVI